MKKARDKFSFHSQNLEMTHIIESEWKIMKAILRCMNHQITGLSKNLGFKNLIEPTAGSHDNLQSPKRLNFWKLNSQMLSHQ